jgi:hypothetical protein
MYMILFVLDDPDRLDELLQGWESVGIRGATIIESTGINRLRRSYAPFRYIFGAHQSEEGHLTLVAVVPDEQFVKTCLQATEALIGDLDQPNTGIFTAWPLSLVKGVPQSPVED